MSEANRVVVYGASGYTGRLVCDYLGRLGLPFIAAGRDKARIQSALEKVAGLDGNQYDVVEVEHAVRPLTNLLEGAAVVCNTVGPFAKLGGDMVEACTAAGSHYIDTTGEQDWLIECDARYGRAMADKGLLLSPGVAQMYTTGEIAADICLERPGFDTLDIMVFWQGTPTIASARTIMVNAAMSKAYYLKDNEYVEWPVDHGLYAVDVPGRPDKELALPWGGTSHPVWFKHDPRVSNVKVLGGVLNRPLMEGVPQIVMAALEKVQGLSDDEKYNVLSEVAAGVINEDPPPEDPTINISLDVVDASGPGGHIRCVIEGTCNYHQTGLLNAYAAQSLLERSPMQVGFASACQAFGHRELLGVLKEHGLVSDPVLTD